MAIVARALSIVAFGLIILTGLAESQQRPRGLLRVNCDSIWDFPQRGRALPTWYMEWFAENCSCDEGMSNLNSRPELVGQQVIMSETQRVCNAAVPETDCVAEAAAIRASHARIRDRIAYYEADQASLGDLVIQALDDRLAAAREERGLLDIEWSNLQLVCLGLGPIASDAASDDRPSTQEQRDRVKAEQRESAQRLLDDADDREISANNRQAECAFLPTVGAGVGGGPVVIEVNVSVEFDLDAFCQPSIARWKNEAIQYRGRARRLEYLAERDPPSQEYSTAVLADLPNAAEPRFQGNEALLADARANAFLDAAVESYERYQGALEVGDQEAAGLQVGSALRFAREARSAAQAAALLRFEVEAQEHEALISVLDAIDATGVTWQTRYTSFREEVAERGLPDSSISFLLAGGVEENELEGIAQRIADTEVAELAASIEIEGNRLSAIQEIQNTLEGVAYPRPPDDSGLDAFARTLELLRRELEA